MNGLWCNVKDLERIRGAYRQKRKSVKFFFCGMKACVDISEAVSTSLRNPSLAAVYSLVVCFIIFFPRLLKKDNDAYFRVATCKFHNPQTHEVMLYKMIEFNVIWIESPGTSLTEW